MTMREPLVPHDASATVAAGGIAALRAKLADDQRSSPVTARAYAHPGLDGKVVIRLEPEAVAAGTDAEMAAFGFSAPKVSPPLGQVRFRTLGFPAWALVHEPKKAKVALGVTEDVRKAKRLVAAKPGHAKDAFEKIAKTLSRSAPQFLPSFWEEVGRVVADQASSSMAAQCFERARQAERAYKLKTDPDDSDAVFVEFALLGALSAKTLSQYAKDLAKAAGGKEAYRRFRAIIIKRALGGMPPYSGMGKDLASLAKGAGLDIEAEADGLAAELIEAPGVAKSPIEFWTTYHDALVRLGKARPEMRTRLRALWPDPKGGSDETRKTFKEETWVELLDEVGALADLPDDGLGDWMSRLIKFAGKTPRIEALLREVAPRLINLRQSIAVVAKRPRWGHDLHLDLAELALELGVPLTEKLDGDDFFPESMTVDPVRVAAHPVYGPKLVEAVESMMGEAEHEHRMRGKQGFAVARRQWIEGRLKAFDGKPLLAVVAAIEALDSKTSAETFLPFPELHERLTHVDLAGALATQLRGGLVDEFTWPAYEEAFAKLGGKEVSIGGAFPILTMWNKSKVLALGPTGVVAEHDFVYKPSEFSIQRAFYLGGEFLVELNPEKGWQNMAYWSSKPKEHFELKAYIYAWGGDVPNAWTLPDGSVTLGQKAFRPGDTTVTGGHNFVCDGSQMWIVESGTYKAYDPVKGTKGAPGGPAWITDWKREGWELDVVHSTVQPAPAGLTSSPLGLRDGLLGIRIRDPKRSDDEHGESAPAENERIDGVRWTGRITPFALLQFPGDDVPRPITTASADNKRFVGGDGSGVELHGPDGEQLATINEHDWASRGWGSVLLPPGAFWDYLSPRDPASSTALRSVTTEAARGILHIAREEVAAGAAESGRALPNTEAAVRAALPQVTDAAIVRGVVGQAERTAELALKLAELAAERSKDNADPGGAGLSGAAALVRKLAAALASGRTTKIPDFEVSLEDWLTHGRAMAALALSPAAEPEERRHARDMVTALAGTLFAEDLSKMRLFAIEAPDDYDDPEDWNTLVIVKHEDSVFAIHASDDWALELSSDGKFRAPPPWKVGEVTKLTTGIGTEWAEKFAALPDEPMPWDPTIAERIAARADLSVPEATLLYAGAPKRNAWGRDFLGKAKREQLGLKMGEADAANTTFKALEDKVLNALITKAVPEDPALLLTPHVEGGYADRIADAWKAKFGKRVKIPQDLLAAAKKELSLGDDLGKLLTAVAGDHDAWFLAPDTRPLNELGGWRDEHGLTPSIAKELATLLSWLFIARPVGCPIRAGIPTIVDRLRKLLDDPKVVWKLEGLYVDEEDAKSKARRQAVLDLVGGTSIEMGKDGNEECKVARDDGAVLIAEYPSNIEAGFRPAKLDGAGRKKAEQLAQAMFEEDNTPGGDPLADIKVALLLRSDNFGAFADRVRNTDVPQGSYEANPLVSAPKLIAKVVKALGLSDAAAALYLQTLALAEPTQKNVTTWNGWKPKQYTEASAELVKKKLVVEGKRERAGRSIFIKGGYTKGDRENLPMEEWKLPFYASLERHVPVEPAHLLFARAWKRLEDGDKP